MDGGPARDSSEVEATGSGAGMLAGAAAMMMGGFLGLSRGLVAIEPTPTDPKKFFGELLLSTADAPARLRPVTASVASVCDRSTAQRNSPDQVTK